MPDKCHQGLSIPLFCSCTVRFQVGSHQNSVKGQNHFPCLAGHAGFYAAQDTIGLLAHVQSLIHYPQVLFGRAVFDLFIPHPVLILAIPWSRCSILHLVLLNPIRFPVTHFLNLSRSLWVASYPSGVLMCWHEIQNIQNKKNLVQRTYVMFLAFIQHSVTE